MIVAHHLIWTIYGYWLPNDPRGSMSKSIRNPKIAALGEIHYGRKRIQPAGKDIGAFRNLAAGQLQHELRMLCVEEIAVVAKSFHATITEASYTCYACAIMPDHVHLVIRRHRDNGDRMIERFQETSADALRSAGLFSANHPIWGGKGWVVYLETAEDIRRCIKYVEDNPIKARRPAQSWEFVKAYDGWMPGLRSGASAKSQARRKVDD
ncbi:MAG: transposase [Planctomycetes bacterium]|nr:transposase [Planctomycetota bacterium]